MFRKKQPTIDMARHQDFAYIAASDVYLDSACQTMRPQPVVDALLDYYKTYNACGERVKYAWGRKVDERVAQTRAEVLKYFGLTSKHYAVSFTLNTTYGLNLLLQQLPVSFKKIITSHNEHNSVHLTTIELAKQLGVPRELCERDSAGGLQYSPAQLADAVVVVNAMSNVDGTVLTNIKQLVADTHSQGGIVIIDAAQTAGHAPMLLKKTDADAICFSAHKAYGASLGVVVAKKQLLESLAITFVGGGMVEDAREQDYLLLPADEIHTRLEAGLQAWGEIIALGTALKWRESFRYAGKNADEYEAYLAKRLLNGLQSIGGLTVLGGQATGVVSAYSDTHDAHQLALYLSEAGVMVRSGYFCAHHYVQHKLGLPPLLRFSIGLHNTEADIDTAVGCLRTFIKDVR
ncbi:MAG: aminotransferase class V-fold PLP-dependent enzyme [Candidatus Saccharimonadales bacterium]